VFGKQKLYTPIGLSVQESAVHAIQFRRVGSGVACHAAAAQRITEGEGLSGELEAVQALFDTEPFAGNRVVSVLRNVDVDLRKLVLPAGIVPDRTPAFAEALTLEARAVLPYSPEHAALDYVVLDKEIVDGHERATLLLIAAKKEHVNRHLALLKTAGLQCLHLDVPPCAAARVLFNGDAVRAVVDIDAVHTDISVCRGQNVLFSRTINCGTRSMVDKIATTLDVSQDEATQQLYTYGIDPGDSTAYNLRDAVETGLIDAAALPAAVHEPCRDVFNQFAAEIRRSVTYFSNQLRGGAIEAITLLGSLIPFNLDGYLTEALAMPVQPARAYRVPVADMAPSPEAYSAFAVAAGLALREDLR